MFDGGEVIKQYFLYLLRWQLSTPILAICISIFPYNTCIKTILANFIGGLLFFWVDKYIFTTNRTEK